MIPGRLMFVLGFSILFLQVSYPLQYLCNGFLSFLRACLMKQKLLGKTTRVPKKEHIIEIKKASPCAVAFSSRLVEQRNSTKENIRKIGISK